MSEQYVAELLATIRRIEILADSFRWDSDQDVFRFVDAVAEICETTRKSREASRAFDEAGL